MKPPSPDLSPARPPAAEAALRRPTEADHRRVADVVDHWFGGRRIWPLAARSWFRHFAGTSWIVDGDRGRPAGFLIGYLSPGRPTEAVLHLMAVEPNRRRQGLGAALVAAFADDAASRGAATISTVAWPDDPIAIAFLRAVGFVAESGPGTQRLFGVDAYPDYEAAGEDRAVLQLAIRDLTIRADGR
jgi:ribosomal protein S18 acetylase RimI-like enzyme